jgi:aldehyde dehydrogenase (NAD+)
VPGPIAFQSGRLPGSALGVCWGLAACEHGCESDEEQGSPHALKYSAFLSRPAGRGPKYALKRKLDRMHPAVRDLMETMEYGPAPEAKNQALDWIALHNGKFQLFIGGNWRDPAEGKWFETHNPSDGSVLARIAQGGAEDVNAAVRAAELAQKTWWGMDATERAKALYAIARQIQKHSRLFAVLESIDNGKPIRETRDIDIPLVARHFYHHAGWAQLMQSEMPGCKPLGVVGQIIPWNFPLLMLAWKIAPALAMGNAVILKPAEFTSLTALLFAEICEAAGVPKGLVNIVTGDGETGKLIVEHPGIAKIAFTGSTEVGRILRKATAGTGKKLSLELGGKSPFIVFDDADLDSAVEGIVDAIWFNQGQVCCAGSRLLIQESVSERFLSKLRRRMETLRVGDPLDKAVDIGAIVAQIQLERIGSLVQQGVAEGATLFQPSAACPDCGWFYPPTLLTNVSPSSTVAQVEIFGPVLVAMTFRTPAEAIALANNTVYGLAASVWSENVNLALDVANKVKAGTVWVNCTNQFDASSGFGGYRESGYGREGGREGLWEYVKPADAQKLAPAKPSVASIDLPAASIDRTYKQYIGGKQARPDSGYSDEVLGADGSRMGEAAQGNRKDIRNAVEAAVSAQGAWSAQPGHSRAQVLYFLAENLEARKLEFASLIHRSTGAPSCEAVWEVEEAISSLFDAAAYSDKFDGSVHEGAFKGMVYTRNESLGVIAVAAPPAPCFAPLVRAIGMALAMGNAVVAVPSSTHPIPAMELVQVIETSDVPGGIINLVTGPSAELLKVLAEHEAVDALWSIGQPELTKMVEEASVSNLKQTWCPAIEELGNLRETLRRATQVKNVWVPIGE